MKRKLQVEDDKLNQELEESHGHFDKMKLVFDKRIDLYHRFLKEDNLNELDMHFGVLSGCLCPTFVKGYYPLGSEYLGLG